MWLTPLPSLATCPGERGLFSWSKRTGGDDTSGHPTLPKAIVGVKRVARIMAVAEGAPRSSRKNLLRADVHHTAWLAIDVPNSIAPEPFSAADPKITL